jgi:hypothetical protein
MPIRREEERAALFFLFALFALSRVQILHIRQIIVNSVPFPVAFRGEIMYNNAER